MLSDTNATFKEINLGEEIEEIEMTIDSSAIPLFIQLLTDMYPNPIEGTVREVISNAIDATKSLPESDRSSIKVTSPTTFNPFFTVKDSGCGMSLETLKKRMINYGNSTKTRGNKNVSAEDDPIGAYGLGAKAPLAYCSEFSVTTTHDGVTTHAIISRLSDKSKTRILYSKYTGEDSGTTIEIPVNSYDFSNFKSAINSYAIYATGVEIIIDDVKSEPLKDYVKYAEINLNEDGSKTGAVYVARRDVNNFLSKVLSGVVITPQRYTLGGWSYSNPNHNQYDVNNCDMILEIKPDVLDFDPSRTNIISNNRSKQLNDLVLSQLFVSDDLALSKVKEVIKLLKPSELLSFSANLLLDNNSSCKDGNITLSNKSYTYNKKSRTIPADFFKNESGFDPLVYMSNEKTSLKTYGFVNLTKNTVLGVFNRNKDFANLTTNISLNEKIQEGIKVLVGRIESDSTYTLERFIYSSFMNLYKKIDSPKSIILLTGVNESDIRSLVRMRGMFIAENGVHDVAFMKEKPAQSDIDTLSENYNLNITIKDLSKVVAELKVKKKALAKEKAAKDDSDSSVLVQGYKATARLSSDEDIPEDYKDIVTRMRLVIARSVNLKEFLDDGNYVIITERAESSYEFRNVLYGVVNKDIELSTDKEILVLGRIGNRYGPSIKSDAYNLLNKYNTVYVSKDFSPKTKASIALKEKNEFYGEYIESSIKSLNKDSVLKFIYQQSRLSRTMDFGIKKIIEKLNDSCFKNYLKISSEDLTEEEKANTSDINLISYDNRVKIFKEALGESLYNDFNSMITFIESPLYSSARENKIFSLVLQGSKSDFDTDIENMIVSKFTEKVEIVASKLKSFS